MPVRRPSNIHERDLATKPFDMSARTIGSMSMIVKAAAVAAIMDSSERMTAATLDEAGCAPLRDFRVQDI